MNLKILTWNIAFGYGIGSEGTADYQPRARDAFEERLIQMSALIKSEDPDLVFLQEVDFAASRSGNLHELDFISRASGVLNRDHVVSWDSPYVPYPGLSLRRQFGKMVSGGGILSRFPIINIQNDLLPKPRENSRIYNYFYLHRYFEIAQIELPGLQTPLRICNLHLEAFSKDNRELHLIKLEDRLKDYSIDISGGDFNGVITISPETLSQGWEPLHPPSATFPSNDPKDILDGFIVRQSRIKVNSVRVIQAGTLSDHLPVMMEVEVLPS